MNLRRLTTIVATIALAVGVSAGAASAAPPTGTMGDQNAQLRALIIQVYQAELNNMPQYRDVNNFGQALSAGFFGNTANSSDNGNGVTPSLAPGIWVCVYEAGSCVDTEKGTSYGELVSDYRTQ